MIYVLMNVFELEIVEKAVGEWVEFRDSQQRKELGSVIRRMEASQTA